MRCGDVDERLNDLVKAADRVPLKRIRSVSGLPRNTNGQSLRMFRSIEAIYAYLQHTIFSGLMIDNHEYVPGLSNGELPRYLRSVSVTSTIFGEISSHAAKTERSSHPLGSEVPLTS